MKESEGESEDIGEGEGEGEGEEEEKGKGALETFPKRHSQTENWGLLHPRTYVGKWQGGFQVGCLHPYSSHLIRENL